MLQIFNTGISYSDIVKLLKLRLLSTAKLDVGEWHSQRVSHPLQQFHELHNVIMEIHLPQGERIVEQMKEQFHPNLPWADDHFKERVSGYPYNPPPSAEWWPFAQNNHAEHVDYHSQFSHSYPERFFPRNAGDKQHHPNHGIRYPYGDLDDVIALLARKPFTRQAYLPVWFPEDTGNVQNVRVPCTLGYHFQIRDDRLNCTYTIRSCDLYRHMNDDIYMAARLMEVVRQRVNHLSSKSLSPGDLVVHIMNLHVLAGDVPKMKQELRQSGIIE